MKLLTTLLALSFSFAVSAQDVNNIEYTTGTVSYNGKEAPVRRSNAGELDKYITKGGKDFSVAYPLMALEKDLSSAKYYVEQNDRKIPFLPHAYEQLAKIKKAIPKFKLTEYEQELKLYDDYNKEFDQNRQKQYANIDELRKKKEQEEARKIYEKEAELARAKRKSQEKQQNADSVKKSFEKMMALAAENEEKARKEDYIKRFGKENATLILRGLVKEGMTAEMVITSLGEPVSKTKAEDGTETWQYLAHKLKFKDGKLLGVDK